MSTNALSALIAAKAAPREETIEPSELWLALTTVPRPYRSVPLPRNKPGTNEPVGEVACWPLRQEEQMAANAAADRYTKEILKDPQKKEEANLGYHHIYTNEVAIQVIFRAMRDPQDVARPAFPTPTLVRRELTTDEIGVLFSHYCTVQYELGPIKAEMSAEEVDALIVRLVKGGSTYPLDSLSWELQRTLVLTLASRVASCWTAMSSAGLPLGASKYALEILGEKDAPEPAAEDDEDEASPPEE